MIILYFIVITITFSIHLYLLSQPKFIGLAWVQNTVNVFVLYQNSVVSYNEIQFAFTKNGQGDDETLEIIKPQPGCIIEVRAVSLVETNNKKYSAFINNVPAILIAGPIAIFFMAVAFFLPNTKTE